MTRIRIIAFLFLVITLIWMGLIFWSGNGQAETKTQVANKTEKTFKVGSITYKSIVFDEKYSEGAVSHTFATSASPTNILLEEKYVQKPVIRIINDSITLVVQDRKLGWVLDQIAQRTQIRIIRDKKVDLEILSIHRENAVFIQVLRQILHKYDVFFKYGFERSIPEVVWIYNKGEGKQKIPMSPLSLISNDEIDQQLIDPNPKQRAQAIKALIRQQGIQALGSVLDALEDGEAKVRMSALDTAVNFGLEIPKQNLAELVQYDPAPEVRFLALSALSTDLVQEQKSHLFDLMSVCEFALNDSSVHVRTQAQQIIGQLNFSNANFD